MGRAERSRPERLGEKLRLIRESLGLSYEAMVIHLDYPRIPLHRASIYKYEKGQLEPPLLIILRYARLVNISTDLLIDDERDLPLKKLPRRA